MKIKVVETCIEADARELRESQTLAQNLSGLMSRMFRPTEPFDDEEEESDREDDEE